MDAAHLGASTRLKIAVWSASFFLPRASSLAALTSLTSLASLVSITHSRHLSLFLMGICRSLLVEDLLKVERQRVLLLGTVGSMFAVKPNFQLRLTAAIHSFVGDLIRYRRLQDLAQARASSFISS